MKCTDSSSDKPSAFFQVKEALSTYVLPQLGTFQLLFLRRTCTAWRDMIDSAPIGLLLPAAAQVLPEGVLSQVTTSVDLLAAAQQQVNILQKLHYKTSSLQQLPKLFSLVQNCTGWSQRDPSKGHCWVAISSWRPSADGGPAASIGSGPNNPRRGMTHPWHQVTEATRPALLPQAGSP